jgi:AcrR family transcriptional regulator
MRAPRSDAAKNRERVLAAADAVFAERGLDATLADIAHFAGVGVGTIYRKFPDKESLVGALLEDKLVKVTAAVEAAADAPSGWDAFAGILSALSDLLLADRALGQILLADYGRETSTRLLDAIRPAVTKAIKRAQADGELRADLKFNDFPPLLIMTTATAEFIDVGNPRSRSRYLDIILDGLRARPGQRKLPGRSLSDAELEAASRSVADRRR